MADGEARSSGRGSLETFREHVRGWLEANAPASLRGTGNAAPFDGFWGGAKAEQVDPDIRRWLELTAGKGWTAPTWPVEYGGAGLEAAEARVIFEEMRALGLPRGVVGFGFAMIGPTLLEFGTEEQKRLHLPRICKGEVRWCQGYSEPNAGSDLASVQMRAIRDGDDYVVDGQKVWTSHADLSDWIFCLTRTDTEVKKQRGITFLLVDMATAGVTARKIELISGASPFCEVFFESVRAPTANVVGEVNAGWTVAKALLGHERSMIGESMGRQVRAAVDTLLCQARDVLDAPEGELPDAALRHALADHAITERCFQLTLARGREAKKRGGAPGPESSIAKIVGSELKQERFDLGMRIAGPASVGWQGPGFEEAELALTRDWLRSRASTIEGGSSEIQLNIIAKRVLGLPVGGYRTAELPLDEHGRMLADTATRFFAERAPVGRLRSLRDPDDEVGFDWALWRDAAELGLAGVHIPEHFGGAGLGFFELSSVLRAAGRSLLPEPLLSTCLLGATALLRAGSEGQKRRWLPVMASGQSVVTVASLEPRARYDRFRVATTARREGAGYVLDGTKIRVPDGHVADAFIVPARTAGAPGEVDGISLFLVAAGVQGLSRVRERRMDLRGSATLRLEGVPVEAPALLGAEGQGGPVLDQVLDVATIGSCAEMLGAADEAFERTLAYLRERVQFDAVLASFQALQHRAARVFIELELLRSAVVDACRVVDARPEELALAASLVKAQADRAVRLAMAEAVQLHGGIGVTDEHDIGFFLKRAQGMAVAFGDGAYHRARFAELRGF